MNSRLLASSWPSPLASVAAKVAICQRLQCFGRCFLIVSHLARRFGHLAGFGCVQLRDLGTLQPQLFIENLRLSSGLNRDGERSRASRHDV